MVLNCQKENQATTSTFICLGQKNLIVQGKEKPGRDEMKSTLHHGTHKICTYVAGAHLTPGMTWKQVEGSIESGRILCFWMTTEKVLPLPRVWKTPSHVRSLATQH